MPDIGGRGDLSCQIGTSWPTWHGVRASTPFWRELYEVPASCAPPARPVGAGSTFVTVRRRTVCSHSAFARQRNEETALRSPAGGGCSREENTTIRVLVQRQKRSDWATAEASHVRDALWGRGPPPTTPCDLVAGLARGALAALGRGPTYLAGTTESFQRKDVCRASGACA